MLYNLSLNKLINGDYRIIQTHLRYTSRNKIERVRWNSYDSKLENNLSRAKTNIFNILSYNKFEFFYTQTVSSKYNRTDLKKLIKRINMTIRDIRRNNDGDFYYLIVPEYHSDGKCWHVHGFISKDFEKYMYLNDNGYYSLSCFDFIGFNSVSKIKHYSACCKYALKYVTKELMESVNKGDRLFYCSQNLTRSNNIESGIISQIAPIHFDYKNEYVFKTDLSSDKFDELYKKLYNSGEFHYRKN